MADAHERFEELALGHVLGGLPTTAASEFRAHLVDCRDCRSRVLELRDIAADLAATEREERRQAAVATQQVLRRAEVETEGLVAPPPGVSRWLRLITPIAIILLVFLAFLTFHWQRVATLAYVSNQRQAEVLFVLGSGENIPVTESAEGVTGDVARHEGTLAFNLVGVEALDPDQVLVLWRFDGDDAEPERLQPPIDGRFPYAADDIAGVDRVAVTIEALEAFRDGDPEEPVGEVVVEVELDD